MNVRNDVMNGKSDDLTKKSTSLICKNGKLSYSAVSNDRMNSLVVAFVLIIIDV